MIAHVAPFQLQQEIGRFSAEYTGRVLEMTEYNSVIVDLDCLELYILWEQAKEGIGASLCFKLSDHSVRLLE